LSLHPDSFLLTFFQPRSIFDPGSRVLTPAATSVGCRSLSQDRLAYAPPSSRARFRSIPPTGHSGLQSFPVSSPALPGPYGDPRLRSPERPFPLFPPFRPHSIDECCLAPNGSKGLSNFYVPLEPFRDASNFVVGVFSRPIRAPLALIPRLPPALCPTAQWGEIAAPLPTTFEAVPLPRR